MKAFVLSALAVIGIVALGYGVYTIVNREEGKETEYDPYGGLIEPS